MAPRLHRRPRLLSAVLLALASASSPQPSLAQRPDTLREPSPYQQLQLLSSVINQIRSNYLDSVTYGELVRAAIDGMLRSLDPHSYYMSRRDWERQNAFERGELPGIGIALEEEDSTLTILSVIPGSPAGKAGVQPGDRVAAINDTVVAGMKTTDAALRLAGPEGSRVKLRIERGPRLEPDTVSFALTRRWFKVPVVETAGIAADHVTGYVRFIWFGPKAADELRDVIHGLQRRGAQQLILDLRDDPGGMLESAVDVASLFFPKGTLIFRTRGRKTDVTKDFATSRDGPFSTLPLIVLLNERSASAAEALAGSLQDHDRALVVGRRSFGKGLMQTPVVLVPTGDIVMLTIGRIVTPSGRVIQRRYRSIGFEQYLSLAGTPGAPEDTVAVFKTDHGREVRGGGGIAPDVVRPVVSELPLWWSVANDSGFALAVADSVAATLPSTPAAREAWVSGSARWSTDLLAPFLQRVRRRLHVAAAPDTALSARMARYLASRVAAVRWPEDGAAELRIRNDPDILIAIPYFGRLPTLLGGSPR